MIYRTSKELCNCCQKSVRLGYPYYECFSCSQIFHSKCFKSSKAEFIHQNFYCKDCKSRILQKYNPFKSMVNCRDEDIDPCLQKMSDVLESCKQYSIKNFNSSIQPLLDSNYGRILFQNIDGNRTNFDALVLALDQIQPKFHVIGLAETNIESDESSVYSMEGYNSFYQSKLACKSKGTGVALYISDKFSAVINTHLSQVSKNLETLFVTIQHDNPVHVCVVYRPQVVITLRL